MHLKRDRAKQHTNIQSSESGPVRRISILSFGYAMPELRQKHEALSKLGFNVLSCSNFQNARTRVCSGKQNFEFFLIGPTVPDHERRTLSDLFREHHPCGRVIFFYRASIRNGERATALLNERGSPGNLLNAIHALCCEKDPRTDRLPLRSEIFEDINEVNGGS